MFVSIRSKNERLQDPTSPLFFVSNFSLSTSLPHTHTSVTGDHSPTLSHHQLVPGSTIDSRSDTIALPSYHRSQQQQHAGPVSCLSTGLISCLFLSTSDADGSSFPSRPLAAWLPQVLPALPGNSWCGTVDDFSAPGCHPIPSREPIPESHSSRPPSPSLSPLTFHYGVYTSASD